MTLLRWKCSAVCYALLLCGVCPADDAPQAESIPSKPADAKLQYLVDRWRDVTIETVDRKVRYEFQPVPLMQWQNPISGADGAVFMWTAAGRPVVLCKCHVNDQKRHYVASSVSLAPQPFVMKAGSRVLWSPKDPGLTLATLADAAPPAEREAARLVQMRAIARRFKLQSVWGEENSSPWELRLLPTPLTRYASEANSVIDGAVFGYAQGTNPEAVVVVEAARTANGLVWQAAPARLTGYAVKAWRDGDLVLDVPDLSRANDVNGAYFHVYERPQPYPFVPAP